MTEFCENCGAKIRPADQDICDACYSSTHEPTTDEQEEN